MKFHPAYTLAEISIVIGLVAVIGGAAITSLIGVKNRQALYASAEEVKTITERARIYARDGKDNRSWGIKKKDDDEYFLVSGSKSSFKIEREYKLIQPAVFDHGNFEIWFYIGTGETNSDKKVRLSSPAGRDIEVRISKIGLVEIVNL